MVIHLIVAVLYVVPSALLIEMASDWDEVGLNKLPKFDTRWNNLVAALVSGQLKYIAADSSSLAVQNYIEQFKYELEVSISWQNDEDEARVILSIGDRNFY